MIAQTIKCIMLLWLATTLASPVVGQEPSKPPKENNGIRYHNGQVMLGSVHVNFIFYGNFTGTNTEQVLIDAVLGLSGSSYHNINTTYYDGTGTHVINALAFGRSIPDAYSRGTSLLGSDIEAIVVSSITSGQLALDPNGLYFVVASNDVDAAGLCTQMCEYHHYVIVSGVKVRYAFIGNPGRCPRQCAPQFFDPDGNWIRVPPNGDFAVDAMVSNVVHNINGMVTNPHHDGWFDNKFRENSDKCFNRFGQTYITNTGGWANIYLRGRDFLIQQNWVNADHGYCALSYP